METIHKLIKQQLKFPKIRIIMLFMSMAIIATVTVAAFSSDNNTVLVSGTLSQPGDPSRVGAQWRQYSNGTIVVEGGNLYYWRPFNDIAIHTRGSARWFPPTIFRGPLNVMCTTAFAYMVASLSNGSSAANWSYVDTSHVTDMSNMFILRSRYLSLSDSSFPSFIYTFDTSNVTNMSNTFYRAAVDRLPLHNWDTSNVTDMSGMFEDVMGSSLYLNIADWDVTSVTDMSRMFARTPHLTSLDISGWDTRNVENMRGMFYRTTSLRELHLGQYFTFITAEASNCVALPSVPQNDYFTGHWQNVGMGTTVNPRGTYVFTSNQLVQYFDGNTMADIWVWQPSHMKPEPNRSISGAFTIPNPVREIIITLRNSTTGQRILITGIPAPPNAYTTAEFAFENLYPGTYSISIFKQGHTSFTINNIVVTLTDDVDLTQDPRFPQQLPLLPGNITGNGQVNILDLNAMLQNWMGSCENANLTGSGQVNASDLNLLLRNWMAESVVVD